MVHFLRHTLIDVFRFLEYLAPPTQPDRRPLVPPSRIVEQSFPILCQSLRYCTPREVVRWEGGLRRESAWPAG